MQAWGKIFEKLPASSWVLLMLVQGAGSRALADDAGCSIAGPQSAKVQGKETLSLYAAHSLRVNAIAAKLDYYWELERNLVDERDQMGQTGLMGRVTELNRQLLQVRETIDRLRQELSRESHILTQMSDQ